MKKLLPAVECDRPPAVPSPYSASAGTDSGASPRADADGGDHKYPPPAADAAASVAITLASDTNATAAPTGAAAPADGSASSSARSAQQFLLSCAQADVNMLDRGARESFSRAVTSMRQPVEWAMHSLKSVFGRLTAILPWRESDRSDLFACTIGLHNFRIRTGGDNQINTFYDIDHDISIFSNAIPDATDVFRRHYE